jgi:hypothetical protein
MKPHVGDYVGYPGGKAIGVVEKYGHLNAEVCAWTIRYLNNTGVESGTSVYGFPFVVKCKNCHCSRNQHARGGKCLFEPTKWERGVKL